MLLQINDQKKLLIVSKIFLSYHCDAAGWYIATPVANRRRQGEGF